MRYKDYYQVMGVPRTASQDEIKKRLEEAAKKLAAQDAAGPEYDPLSIEPAMLERAREASLLAREAMDRVLDKLSDG